MSAIVKVQRRNLRPGDTLVHYVSREDSATVTGIAQARAKGYWIAFVTPLTAEARAVYPNGQTSGHGMDEVEVRRK